MRSRKVGTNRPCVWSPEESGVGQGKVLCVKAWRGSTWLSVEEFGFYFP